jgi:hypothetical protein
MHTFQEWGRMELGHSGPALRRFSEWAAIRFPRHTGNGVPLHKILSNKTGIRHEHVY